MAFELEALVGHLYMVSGRAISAQPPGLLVEVAPTKAARGREMDTFFALVLPSGDKVAQATFYEQMTHLAAERYFSSTGSVTSGLRAVYNSLNQNLYEHNSSGKKPFEANVLCAVLHGEDLFMTRVGSGVGLLYYGGETQAFPAPFDNDDALFGPPLGVQPVPDIKMTRYRVVSGARLVLADPNLAELPLEKMSEALRRPDIGEVINGFKELVSQHLTLLAVEFMPPDMPAPIPVREGESTATVATPAASAAPAATSITAPVAEVVAPAPPSRLNTLATQTQRSAGRAALTLAGGLDTVSKKLDRPPNPDAPQGRLFSILPNSVVLLIPVAIVLMAVFMWLGGTGESEFELCVTDAVETAAIARAIDSSDVNGVLAAWNAVLSKIESCNQIRAGDEQLAAITREGQDTIDRLYIIQRREATVIEAFTNATLTRAILRGEDLYVLDDANDQVYRVTLNAEGLAPVARQPIVNMRRGAAVGQYAVGDIIDITWAEDGSGLTQGNVLISLDRDGVIVEYSPTFLSRGVQKLIGIENWANTAVKITVWQGRLYILDPGSNQIWRYEASGGSFPNAPTEYFAGQGRPNLESAVDFGIDNNGRVFVLFRDGFMSVYRGGELQPFAFVNFPENQNFNSADAMFLNSSLVFPGIYLVSRANSTIYETTLAGTFSNSYRAYDEDQFAGLTNVVADESKSVIYTLSGNSILAFRK